MIGHYLNCVFTPIQVIFVGLFSGARTYRKYDSINLEDSGGVKKGVGGMSPLSSLQDQVSASSKFDAIMLGGWDEEPLARCVSSLLLIAFLFATSFIALQCSENVR